MRSYHVLCLLFFFSLTLSFFPFLICFLLSSLHLHALSKLRAQPINKVYMKSSPNSASFYTPPTPHRGSIYTVFYSIHPTPSLDFYFPCLSYILSLFIFLFSFPFSFSPTSTFLFILSTHIVIQRSVWLPRHLPAPVTFSVSRLSFNQNGNRGMYVVYHPHPSYFFTFFIFFFCLHLSPFMPPSLFLFFFLLHLDILLSRSIASFRPSFHTPSFA